MPTMKSFFLLNYLRVHSFFNLPVVAQCDYFEDWRL